MTATELVFIVLSSVTVCPISSYSWVLLIDFGCFLRVSFPLRNSSLNMEIITDDRTNSTFSKKLVQIQTKFCFVFQMYTNACRQNWSLAVA